MDHIHVSYKYRRYPFHHQSCGSKLTINREFVNSWGKDPPLSALQGESLSGWTPLHPDGWTSAHTCGGGKDASQL